MFGNQPPDPPTFGRDIPKKLFFLTASLSKAGGQPATELIGGFLVGLSLKVVCVVCSSEMPSFDKKKSFELSIQRILHPPHPEENPH